MVAFDIGMYPSSSANDKLMRAMVYEGVSGVCDKRGGDQCGWFQ